MSHDLDYWETNQQFAALKEEEGLCVYIPRDGLCVSLPTGEMSHPCRCVSVCECGCVFAMHCYHFFASQSLFVCINQSS
jgi:hypothetical protein